MSVRRSLVIGLTGGLASGKSMVEKAFLDQGVPVIDADQVAREVVAPGEAALAAIVERFGEEVLTADGSLDRPALRAIVFAADDARRDLEAITHPAIRDRLLAWQSELQGPYGVLSAPLLVEGGLYRMCDRVLVVDADPELQRERVMARDGIDEALAERMIASQADRETRLAVAHDVLRNVGSVEALLDAVARLHDFYTDLAEGRADPEERWALP